MPVGDDTFAYRSRLPHLRKSGKQYFVTFCSQGRRNIPPEVRSAVLASHVQEHNVHCWLFCAVVMPDHVHLILQPNDDVALTALIGQMKGRSSLVINQSIGRRGSFWQRDSFDHILRPEETLTKQIQYVCDNPVRKGLVAKCDDYPWLWRAWRHTSAG